MAKQTLTNGRELRAEATQVADLANSLKQFAATMSQEEIVRISLKIAELKSGTVSSILDIPNVAPRKEAKNEKLENHIYFQATVDNVRVAKRTLQKYYQLDHLPQAQLTTEPGVYQMSVYYISYTSADQLVTKYAETFIKATLEKLSKSTIPQPKAEE